MGAGAGHQHTSRTEQAECAKIDLFVAAGRSLQCTPRLGEGWGIEHHQRKLTPGRRVAGQQVEDVRLAELYVRDPVGGSVLVGEDEGLRGAVHGLYRVALARQVQRKSATRGEAVERLAPRILRRREVVFPLIEEDAGLLPFQQI